LICSSFPKSNLEYFAKIIEAQQRLMLSLSDSVNTKSRNLSNGGFYIGYKIVEPEMQRYHFEWNKDIVGLVRNYDPDIEEHDEAVAVTFDLEGLDDAIRRLTIWKLSRDRAEKIETHMQRLLDESIPITEFKL